MLADKMATPSMTPHHRRPTCPTERGIEQAAAYSQSRLPGILPSPDEDFAERHVLLPDAAQEVAA
jgi:hypothetical protein